LGSIYTSADFGSTWTQTSAPSGLWSCLASSADGTSLLAGAGLPGAAPGSVYTSRDSGSSWTSNSLPVAKWGAAACSADGSRLLAVGSAGIFTSTDYGGTWVSNSTPTTAVWVACASSADGSKLVVAANEASGGPRIYTRQSTPTPALNLTSSTRQLSFSWVASSAPFLLQENQDLATSHWQIVPEAPTLNLTSLQYVVTVTATNSRGFYRLSAP
jgi:hypothetical protein